jgi:hypothetical protein
VLTIHSSEKLCGHQSPRCVKTATASALTSHHVRQPCRAPTWHLLRNPTRIQACTVADRRFSERPAAGTERHKCCSSTVMTPALQRQLASTNLFKRFQQVHWRHIVCLSLPGCCCSACRLRCRTMATAGGTITREVLSNAQRCVLQALMLCTLPCMYISNI